MKVINTIAGKSIRFFFMAFPWNEIFGLNCCMSYTVIQYYVVRTLATGFRVKVIESTHNRLDTIFVS